MLQQALHDPLVAELMGSHTRVSALLTVHDEGLRTLSASKHFRQLLGHSSNGQALLARYGQTITDNLQSALSEGSGWTGSVRIQAQWVSLRLLPWNGLGLLEETPLQPKTEPATPSAAVGLDFPPAVGTLVLHLNDQGIILGASESLGVFMGQESSELKGVDALNLVYRSDAGQFKRLLDQVKYRTTASEGAFRMRNADNQVLLLDWTAAGDGNDIILVGRQSQHHVEAALLQSEERINSILESMSDAFFAIDLHGHISYVNAKGAELLGKPAQLLLGRVLWDRAPQMKKTQLFHTINQAKGSLQPETFQWQNPQDEVWYQIKAYPSQDLISVFFTDISTIKRSENNMRHQAMHDTLTGLPNRLALSQVLDELLNTQAVTQMNMGLLFIDLDGFKAVNDTLGHDKGDELLIAVSKRLKGVVRNSDIVARLSGDEFVITLPYIPGHEAAFNVGRKVVDAVSKRPYELADKAIYIGASVGVALYPEDAQDVESLLKHADIAMYQAKQAGKNTVRMFHSAMSTSLQTKVNLENELHHAIVHDRMELHYQPRMNPQGKVCAVEALARLRNTQGDLVAPLHFIPIAEETGLIIAMGAQVLKKACEWIGQLNTELSEPIGLSVNVSGIQLLDGHLTQTVADVLRDTGFPPHLLELELTETVLMQNHESVHEDLVTLHNMGVHLSIDDFGTGYSSLSMLHKLPVQSIKLDRSFVCELPNTPDSVIITRTVLAMATALGLGVVAEGVETDEQRDFLIDSGVQELQGFGLAKPMTDTDLQAFLKAQNIPGKLGLHLLAGPAPTQPSGQALGAGIGQVVLDAKPN